MWTSVSPYPEATLLVFAAWDGKVEASNIVAAQVTFQVTAAAADSAALPQSLALEISTAEVLPGRGLHSSTSRLNLSRS